MLRLPMICVKSPQLLLDLWINPPVPVAQGVLLPGLLTAVFVGIVITNLSEVFLGEASRSL